MSSKVHVEDMPSIGELSRSACGEVRQKRSQWCLSPHTASLCEAVAIQGTRHGLHLCGPERYQTE